MPEHDQVFYEAVKKVVDVRLVPELPGVGRAGDGVDAFLQLVDASGSPTASRYRASARPPPCMEIQRLQPSFGSLPKVLRKIGML